MHSLWRTAVALALVPWLGFSGSLAPEHLHEADAHHPHATIHRHFGPHDHDAAEIEHDEGRVIWLDAAAIPPATYRFALADAVAPAPVDVVPEHRSWIVISTLDVAPPHGPPRGTTSLRGPPFLSL